MSFRHLRGGKPLSGANANFEVIAKQIHKDKEKVAKKMGKKDSSTSSSGYHKMSWLAKDHS